ncbi:hypothetical protein [Streptomyces sp. 3N207]|uniref:hypothetical protein n=1 Tax=Streptomyces sp. 3N207 TaxID=3457417 RepID=UPI003FD0ACA5
MSEETTSSAAARTWRVLSIATFALEAAYIGMWAYISLRLLPPFLATQRVDPPFLVAVGMIGGPFFFWAFIGSGGRMSVLGWVDGCVVTGGLATLSFAALAAVSAGHGFTYWLMLGALVVSQFRAFCLLPYASTRCLAQRR